MNEITDIFEKSMATEGIQICIIALIILVLFSQILKKLPFIATKIGDNFDSKIMDFLIAIPSILFSLYITDEFLIFKTWPEVGDVIYTASQLFSIFLSIIIMEGISYVLKLKMSSSERSQSRLAASIHILILFIFLNDAVSIKTIGYSLVLLGRLLFYDTTFDLKKVIDAVKWIVRQAVFFLGLSIYTCYLVISVLGSDYSMPGLIGLNIAIAGCFWVARKIFFVKIIKEYRW